MTADTVFIVCDILYFNYIIGILLHIELADAVVLVAAASREAEVALGACSVYQLYRMIKVSVVIRVFEQ